MIKKFTFAQLDKKRKPVSIKAVLISNTKYIVPTWDGNFDIMLEYSFFEDGGFVQVEYADGSTEYVYPVGR